MKCMICDSPCDYFFSKSYAPHPFGDVMNTIRDVDYYRCQRCGFTSSKTHQLLSAAQLQELNVEVHELNENDPEMRNYVNQPPYAEQALMIGLFRSYGLIACDGMLDYAGGVGTLSNLLKKLFGINLPIYDPYMQAGDLTRYVRNPREEHYKTVVNSAFFEHVISRSELDLVNSMVAQDGCLILHTLICENIPRDPDWFYLRPPVHVAFHTNKSMNILMEQWGFRSSIYCPQSKSWTLFHLEFQDIQAKMEQINRDLQTTWLYGKSGFVDYWKGF